MNTALINKEAYKYGGINGLLGILLMYGSWSAGLSTYISVQLYGMWIPFMMVILIIGGLQLRKANGGYLSFKEALRFSFLSYVISGVAIAIATYILYNVVDKGLDEASFNAGLEKARQFMEKTGASDDKIEEMLDSTRKNKTQTNIKTVFLGLGLDLIWAFVKSLAVTLLIRKEKPVSFEL